MLRLGVAVVLLAGSAAIPWERAGAAVRVADVVWDGLAECESGGDWQADTGNGYYGGLQIWPPTWEVAGGLRFADRPDHASRREQTTVGEEILRRQGWEAWPDCARELGLIGGSPAPGGSPTSGGSPTPGSGPAPGGSPTPGGGPGSRDRPGF
ncbi:transglycosylase family protein [Kitasatospora sp. NPDC091276]|uniref:transglycosylase family protein n=1 Tax=Kitasatospora sp. NPDC091276 TaxID=3155300 RepID=UPI00342C7453